MVKIRRMFPGGNTSQGFYSFHDNIIGENRNMLYIIKGMPGGGKSSLMREIGKRILDQGFDLEYHHCPSDPYSIDGIVINKLKIAIVDGTPPHGIDCVYPGVKDKIIDLGRFIDEALLRERKEEIIRAKKNNKFAYRKAFGYLKGAKIVYELIEESNKIHVDRREVNKKTLELLDKIFSSKEVEVQDYGFQERLLFTTAYTPEGYFDYSKSIFMHINNVYYIKGQIGTNKDLILKRIVEMARLRNYGLELYHNSLMPDKLESVFIRELDTMVSLNNNALSHTNYILDLDQDIDIDMLNKEDYGVYKILLDKGIETLKGAKKNHMILEKSYKDAIDYSQIDAIREKVYEEILEYM